VAAGQKRAEILGQQIREPLGWVGVVVAVTMAVLIIDVLMLLACGIVTEWPRLPLRGEAFWRNRAGPVTPSGLRPVEHKEMVV